MSKNSSLISPTGLTGATSEEFSASQQSAQTLYKQRRGFLKGSLATVLGLCVAIEYGHAASAQTEVSSDRRLQLVNVHTGDQLDVIYWSGGRYIRPAMDQINQLMRDHRANESIEMDPRVLDFLHSLQRLGKHAEQNTDSEAPREVQILSGYRSPATNAMLARKSNRVAKNSLHMVGKAIDCRVPGIKTRQLRDIAIASRRGGVGYYPKSDFLHIDSGAVRHWG